MNHYVITFRQTRECRVEAETPAQALKLFEAGGGFVSEVLDEPHEQVVSLHREVERNEPDDSVEFTIERGRTNWCEWEVTEYNIATGEETYSEA